MPKREILMMCEKAIKKDLDSLDDLPHELANTIANVYYKFYNLAGEVMDQSSGNPNWLPTQAKRELDLGTGLKSFVHDFDKFMNDRDAAPNFIRALREIDKRLQPNLYRFTVNFILDCLKYDIKNAGHKTQLRRMLERKLHKNRVQEIQGLIDLLDV